MNDRKPSLLHALVETGALRPPVDWENLAEAHVAFDDLNDTKQFEGALLREAAQERGATVVLGASGSGKSSLIAAVAEEASPQRWIVRVQGGSADDLLGREGFAHHVAREALRALDRDEAAPTADTSQVEDRLADCGKVTRGGHIFGSKGVQVRSAIEEVVNSRDTSDVFAALDELAEVSSDAGRRMLLVVEDTDVFMPPRDIGGMDPTERAVRFISQVLPFLAREVSFPSLIAVNSRYENLIAEHLSGTANVVWVPSFADPASALKEIMARQARRQNLHTDSTEVIEPEALKFLAEALQETDLRAVLRAIYDGAVKTAREDPDATQISLASVTASL